MQERRRQKRGNVYGFNSPTVFPRPKPIIQDENPTVADLAQIGTYWINNSTLNVFVKGKANNWIDLAGGPGTGIFDSITTLGTGLPTPGGAVVAQVGSIIAILGNLISGGNVLAPSGTVTADSATLTSCDPLDVLVNGAATMTLQTYPDSVLITDSNGTVDPAQQQGANGQLIIAATSGQPQWATITSTGGSIAFTPGANTLNIERASLAIVDDFDGNSGTASQSSGTIVFAGGANMVTSALGNTMAVGLLDDITLATSVASSGDAIIATTTVTAGTGLTITANDMAIVAGSLTLPTTNLGAGKGAVYVNSVRFIHAQAGDQNIFLAAQAGNATLTGVRNTGVGSIDVGTGASLRSLTTGTDNTMLANGSGEEITTGNFNTGFGWRACDIQTTTSNNTGLGGSNTMTLGSATNTEVGWYSIFELGSTGNGCVGIGSVTRSNSNTSNLISIQTTYTANPASRTSASNQVWITTTTENPVTKHFWGDAQGIYGVTTDSGTTSTLLVSDQGQLGDMASSRRYKFNIQEMAQDSTHLYALRPVRFNYKLQRSKPVWPGLIAEEVQLKMPHLVNLDETGEPDNVRYHDLDVMILNEMIKLNQRLAGLERRYAD